MGQPDEPQGTSEGVDDGVIRVGAPVLTPRPPSPGTPGDRFNNWLGRRHVFIGALLERLSYRWGPVGSFIELHFHDEYWGMCGALVSLVPAAGAGRDARLRRVSAIPFSEMVPFVPRWRAGETVLVHVDEMPAPLARRYHATQVRWSLNIPLVVEEEWVGLIGAGIGDRDVPDELVASYESSARVLVSEYEADSRWQKLRNDMTQPGIMTSWINDLHV